MTELSILQEKVKAWVEKKGFKWFAYADYCPPVSENGELGKALIFKHGEREQSNNVDPISIEDEIGDILFSIIVLANKYDINLDVCMKKTFDKYNKKVKLREK